MFQNESVCPRPFLFQVYEYKEEGGPKEKLLTVNGDLLV